MTDAIKTDIVIAGAGPAGLAAACAFGSAGHRVILVDPVTPVTGENAPGADLRTTALLQPARDLLVQAEAWGAIEADATALWTMRMVEASGTSHLTRDFKARDVSDAPFGWNVANWALRRALLERVAALPEVETKFGASVASLFVRDSGARVTLDDGERLAAKLVVACDGRNSPLREMAGIGVHRADYGQTAIVFAVAHEMPHDDVSTEIHRTGGPFTLVPLPDRDGQHRSSVVWMDTAAEQTRRMALDDAAFAEEANERSAGVMGPLDVVSPRGAWPITSVLAERFTARRLALIGEAAHGMPPIGAQGLNTSLKDVAALRDLAARYPLGSDEMLDGYARARRGDVTMRVAGIDLLNRTSIAGIVPIQALRAAGIAALHDIPPLRRAAMRLGLGAAPVKAGPDDAPR
ncbi:2-octaprenyl-3-methyl-6-methoxy-1,4-benzoquinol hydroxylase [Jannaschia seosinensis]|uniref:2-octaprenyl-3-methyl-6-methoxy-1,4-benzoquinol hydroxylase n=1 Tax=Jannaschia seosinensis TaxID=313367 RepID=A0A0M7BG82_9RHOB|nr:FAD-dependent monooxygenase [Jannaschia seosinensis]CUH41098.1 2-octaprenyl-3-methyl-6-methoxy-1,4-benzoquinol hydroxylase [Jannaschia seosinensis]